MCGNGRALDFGYKCTCSMHSIVADILSCDNKTNPTREHGAKIFPAGTLLILLPQVKTLTVSIAFS